MKLTRTLKYLKTLGPAGFAAAAAQVALRRPHVALRVPGHPFPLFARQGSSDGSTFEQVFVDRAYELHRPLQRPALLVDAGANVGYASVYLAQRYPDATVIALEPEPTNFALLRQNTRPYPNVRPMQAALWSAKTRLDIANPGDEKNSIRVREAARGAGDVETLTVPDVLALAGRKRIDLLKIDIEGAEKELFEAADTTWLGRVDHLVIELHDWMRPGCSAAFYRALVPYAFDQFIRGENLEIVFHHREAGALPSPPVS